MDENRCVHEGIVESECPEREVNRNDYEGGMSSAIGGGGEESRMSE